VADEDLTPRERRVLALVEDAADGHERVAARLGMTRSRVEQILATARDKRDR
jgi:hypothetical protein